MSNTYRALSPLGKALHGEEPFEADFTAAEERDHLAGGHLEIVPRPYRVLTSRFAAGQPGETVELALPVEQEAMLLGVHIERVKAQLKGEPGPELTDIPARKKAAKAADKKD